MSHHECQHIVEANFTKSLQGRKIFKDQCVRCFRDPTHPGGLFVCLKCFNGVCGDHIKAHDANHNHPLYLRITAVLRPKPQKKQITKLGIGIEGGAIGENEYDYFYKLWCSRCERDVPEGEARLAGQIQSLINANSPFRKQQLVAWEVQVHPCEHTLTLQQEIKNYNLDHCGSCDLSTNLWLCLTCGNVGCGRKQFDGSGGNNHGIAHYEHTKHPLVVKLGTITAEGTASIYCYLCNTEVKDQLLSSHLRQLGVNIKQQKKTEKTIEQINLDVNINWALSKLVESKEKEQLLYGAGLTGINNIGNTCYMNSVLQVLNSLPEFRKQYYQFGEQHLQTCKKIPGDCFYCQVAKIFWGLDSGIYSQKQVKTLIVNQVQSQEEYQEGIKPFDFKILLAKDHPQFSSTRQQDALEYLQWVFERLEKEQPFIGESTTKHFNFQSVNRLICSGCNGYKLVEVKTNEWKFPVIPPTKQHLEEYYTQLEQLDSETKKAKLCQDPEYDIKMQDCLNILKAGEAVSVNCPKCKSEQIFLSRHYFKTTPKYLLAVPNRFVLEKWVPKKLNALIGVQQHLNISDFLLQNAAPAGEKLQMALSAKYSEQNVNMLMSMGFSANACKRALIQTKNDVEAASIWIMQNLDSADLNSPLPEEKEEGPVVNMELVGKVMQFGFDETQAKIALIQNKNNAEAALEWLFSQDGNVLDYLYLLDQDKKGEEKGGAVCPNYRLKAVVIHLGKSVHSGHYVAYVRGEKGWVLFNDQRVTLSKYPVLGKGYIYLYESV